MSVREPPRRLCLPEYSASTRRRTRGAKGLWQNNSFPGCTAGGARYGGEGPVTSVKREDTGQTNRSRGCMVRGNRHGGRRPAIHAFPGTNAASRGWRAGARHDDEGAGASVERFVRSAARRNDNKLTVVQTGKGSLPENPRITNLNITFRANRRANQSARSARMRPQRPSTALHLRRVKMRIFPAARPRPINAQYKTPKCEPRP